MEIKSFKLVKKGNSGISIKTEDHLQKGRTTIPFENSPKLNIPVPINLRGKIQELTYPFLKLMLVWKDEWTKFLTEDLKDFKVLNEDISKEESIQYLKAKTLFKDSYIIGAEKKKNGLYIEGTLPVTDTKNQIYKTFVIEENDDAHLFNIIVEILDDICLDLVEFFKDDRLLGEAEAKQYLLEFNKNEDAIENINEMTEEEAVKAAEEILEKKGYVIFPTDETDALEENAGNKEENNVSESEEQNPEISSEKTIANDVFENAEEQQENQVDTDDF